jgi:PIN domain nuclease of toxin-antitoxin system
VRLLLDSQVVLWSLESPERLPTEVVAAITDPANSVDVSVVSLWELAIKQSIGRLKVDGDLREHLTLQSFSLPPHHRDPFDRLLIAQAMCEELTVVTRDRAFAAYNVPILPA